MTADIERTATCQRVRCGPACSVERILGCEFEEREIDESGILIQHIPIETQIIKGTSLPLVY